MHKLLHKILQMAYRSAFTVGSCKLFAGIGASEGPLWREHRKFVHGVFRDFGVGRPVFEEKIQEEISFLLQVRWRL